MLADSIHFLRLPYPPFFCGVSVWRWLRGLHLCDLVALFFVVGVGSASLWSRLGIHICVDPSCA